MKTIKNSLSDVLNRAAAALKKTGTPTPVLDAEVLLSHCLGLDRTGLYVNLQKPLSPEEIGAFEKLVVRRAAGEPVAYIVGRKEFWSLPFHVGPAVLIPRPDTEILVEEILRIAGRLGKDRLDILEIGTGSGAVSIALAGELKNARIVATDCSKEAIEVAKKNAAVNALAGRISFLQGNLFDPLCEKFDIIASNPPYLSEEEFNGLPPGVRLFEPREALLAGPEGTEFHQALIQGGRSYLRDGGWLIMEIGDRQKDRIANLFRIDGGYAEVDFTVDYAGLFRVVRARKGK